jgi:hypothetical protein
VLARAPPPRGGGGAAAAAAAAKQVQKRAAARAAGAAAQPELPPPWVEGPPRDKTQGSTLPAAALAAVARERLAAWAGRQEGAELLGEPQVGAFLDFERRGTHGRAPWPRPHSLPPLS